MNDLEICMASGPCHGSVVCALQQFLIKVARHPQGEVRGEVTASLLIQAPKFVNDLLKAHGILSRFFSG